MVSHYCYWRKYTCLIKKMRISCSVLISFFKFNDFINIPLCTNSIIMKFKSLQMQWNFYIHVYWMIKWIHNLLNPLLNYTYGWCHGNIDFCWSHLINIFFSRILGPTFNFSISILSKLNFSAEFLSLFQPTSTWWRRYVKNPSTSTNLLLTVMTFSIFELTSRTPPTS